MTTTFDLHLAAAAISPTSIARLTELGFVRDAFLNFTHCHTGEYHATYRGRKVLPDDPLWNGVCQLLANDERFVGYLEEEATAPQDRRTFVHHPGTFRPPLPRLDMAPCPAGRRKSCDVHLGIEVEATDPASIAVLSGLGASSVDRPSEQGCRRVFTLTFESLSEGRQVFEMLWALVERLPHVVGRIKLETISRHFRKPDDAVTLPIALTGSAVDWLEQVRPLLAGGS